jgi:hypothetical protein
MLLRVAGGINSSSATGHSVAKSVQKVCQSTFTTVRDCGAFIILSRD